MRDRGDPPTSTSPVVGSSRLPAAAWQYPSQRRAVTAATVIGVALVAIAALLAYQLFTVDRPPPLLEASLLLGPLFLVARYPLMAWRTSVAAAVVVALGVVFCLAGLSQARAVRWWMYAFTVVPTWLLLHHPVEVAVAIVGLAV